jgi:HEAT repeat protein
MGRWTRIIGIVALAAAGCSRSPAEPLRSHGHTAAEWAEVLRGPDVKARRRAVTALANLGAADPAVVPALASALKDADAEVRASAATALFNIGPGAKDAIPALETARIDRDAKVRDHAAKALDRVNPR